MIVGIPKEIKNNENRVSLTPAGAHELVQRGHTVYIQHTAGINSGFSDEEYEKVGARILPTIKDVYAIAEMIIKVKEPIECEYNLVRKDQLVFTYFHFACDKELTEAMMRSGSVCLAYETVTDKQGGLPLLIPMSEVAGRMSTQEGARFLEKPQGGRGILLGGVPGVKPAKVLVLGGGIVGTNAALMAAGLGADVTICDISLPRLRQLSEFMPKNVKTLFSSSHNIEKELPTTDLIIGAVLIPGAKAPHLITRPIQKLMKKGAMIYLYNGGFHHSKIMMVDDLFCTVGTANQNSRSLRYDYETNAIIFDKDITQQLNDVFEADMLHCTRLTPEMWKQKSAWKKFKCWFANLFTPFL